jgi:hypothetical protein
MNAELRESAVAVNGRLSSLPYVEADVNYAGPGHFGPNATRPVLHPNDERQNSIDLQATRIRLHDARVVKSEVSLMREGFTLVRHKVPPLNLNNYEELHRSYLSEAQRVLEEVTQAAKVVVTEGVFVRTTVGKPASIGWMPPGRPALHVHTDYTTSTARGVLERSYDRRFTDAVEGYADTRNAIKQSIIDPESGGEIRYKRVIGVQTWRVLSPPPQDSTLGLCAADSVSSEDIVEGDFILSLPGSSQTKLIPYSFYGYSSRHRWFYFSDLEPDELLIFLSYDFARPLAGRVVHSAFELPGHPEGATRTSIEGRAFAFFED